MSAYEAGKHMDSGPASKTIGPHDSNIANVLDPRVKPQPELMKGNKSEEHSKVETNPRAGQAGRDSDVVLGPV